MDQGFKKLTAAGLLLSLGIIYGDIGTSPLYTFQTLLVDGGKVDTELIYGSISCIFWTLTLQTTFKYVLITLQADNHGEGGIFSLYALVRRFGKWLAIPAIIGAGTLLADGIITPPISVTSAIEGLNLVPEFSKYIVPGNELVLFIVIAILLILFFCQQFGTQKIGSWFGPIMLIWFSMIGLTGFCSFIHHAAILKAVNPWYGLKLLIDHPKGFWLLGAVFLCTTGAEALYSDLGHCGRKNIRVSWIFVKTTLVLNYLGQGAWVLSQPVSKSFQNVNPFFEIIPHFFLLPGIAIATMATIIASQALISGSFTLINEAISMNFWPRVTVRYPSDIRGQIYVPTINWILCCGCVAVAIYFRTSEAMTAAYGFSITVAMLMTTILVYMFIRHIKHWPLWLVTIILCVFLTVEFSFFVANAVKLLKRLFFLVFEFGLIGTMYIWYRASRLINRVTDFVDIDQQISSLKDLRSDQQIPRFSTHLIYTTAAQSSHDIEKSVMHSILSRTPKRADLYWFIHIKRADEPYVMEYSVKKIENDLAVRIDFNLGFRVQPKLNILLRNVFEELVKSDELNLISHYESLKKYNLLADFQFVILEKFLSTNNEFSKSEDFILKTYFAIKKLALTEPQAFGIDTSETKIECVPLVFNPIKLNLKRVPFRD